MKLLSVLLPSVLMVSLGAATPAFADGEGEQKNGERICVDCNASRASNSAYSDEIARLRERIKELEARMADRCRSGHNLDDSECEPETKTTITGAKFQRDTTYSKLGEAWKDEDGMIWGDIVKNEDGSIRTMNHYAAKAYCEGLGATLPSRDDFVRLRKYMGATTEDSDQKGTGYTPYVFVHGRATEDTVLPNLTRQKDGQTVSNSFWSSSVAGDVAYSFDGLSGYVYRVYRSEDDAVRCVRR